MKNKQLWLLLSVFVFVSVCFRLPFYFDYPLPGLTRDAFSYIAPLEQLKLGQAPVFTFYTPGYPLFLAITYYLGIQTLTGLFLSQFIVTLALYIVAIYYLAKRLKNKRVLYFTVALLCVFYNSPIALTLETALGPMAIFTAFIVLAITLCAYIFYTPKSEKTPLLLVSFCLAMLVAIRPQAIIMAAPAGILFIWLLTQKRYRDVALAYSFPLVTLFCICLYNYTSLGSFSYTSQKFTQTVRSSVFFLEKGNGQPSYITNAIDSVNAKLALDFPGKDREEVVTTNLANMDVFGDYFVDVITRNTGELTAAKKEEILTACSKNKNQALYRKKIAYTFGKCLFSLALKKEFYLTEIKNRQFFIAQKTEYQGPATEQNRRLATREYYDYFYGPKNTAELLGSGGRIKLYKPVFIINTLYTKIFQPVFFAGIYLAALVFFTFMAVKEMLKKVIPWGLLLWLAILAIPLVNAAIIAMFVYPSLWYNYPPDLIMLFSPLILVVAVLVKTERLTLN